MANWHIIHDRELRVIRMLDIKRRRKFTKQEIFNRVDGNYQKQRVEE